MLQPFLELPSPLKGRQLEASFYWVLGISCLPWTQSHPVPACVTSVLLVLHVHWILPLCGPSLQYPLKSLREIIPLTVSSKACKRPLKYNRVYNLSVVYCSQTRSNDKGHSCVFWGICLFVKPRAAVQGQRCSCTPCITWISVVFYGICPRQRQKRPAITTIFHYLPLHALFIWFWVSCQSTCSIYIT